MGGPVGTVGRLLAPRGGLNRTRFPGDTEPPLPSTWPLPTGQANPAFCKEQVEAPTQEYRQRVTDGMGQSCRLQPRYPEAEADEEERQREAADHPGAMLVDLAPDDASQTDGRGAEPEDGDHGESDPGGDADPEEHRAPGGAPRRRS